MFPTVKPCGSSIYPHQRITTFGSAITQPDADDASDEYGLIFVRMRALDVTEKAGDRAVQIGQVEWPDGPAPASKARCPQVAAAEPVQKIDLVGGNLVETEIAAFADGRIGRCIVLDRDDHCRTVGRKRNRRRDGQTMVDPCQVTSREDRHIDGGSPQGRAQAFRELRIAIATG
jgi:hypothetical protein